MYNRFVDAFMKPEKVGAVVRGREALTIALTVWSFLSIIFSAMVGFDLLMGENGVLFVLVMINVLCLMVEILIPIRRDGRDIMRYGVVLRVLLAVGLIYLVPMTIVAYSSSDFDSKYFGMNFVAVVPVLFFCVLMAFVANLLRTFSILRALLVVGRRSFER